MARLTTQVIILSDLKPMSTYGYLSSFKEIYRVSMKIRNMVRYGRVVSTSNTDHYPDFY